MLNLFIFGFRDDALIDNFDADQKVADAAAHVRKMLDYPVSGENVSFQNKRDEVLDPTKTLSEEGVEDRDELYLVTAGGSV